MINEKPSFFEKLTGVVSHTDVLEEQLHRENDTVHLEEPEESPFTSIKMEEPAGETPSDEGQLTVDVYQTPTHIMVQAPLAGVRPEDIDVSINNDMITIRGKRHQKNEVGDDSYYYRELFWGPFSRSVLMPDEVDSNRTEASFKNGLLTVKMPKVNKDGVKQVKIQAREV